MNRLVVAFATALCAACDTGSVEPPTLESNVTVLTGVDVTTTDEAVLVGGAPRIRLGDAPRGMVVQHATDYSYGGPYEKVNDELVGESWYMDVWRQIVTAQRSDSVFRRDLDFGDLALEGTPALRIEIDTVEV